MDDKHYYTSYLGPHQNERVRQGLQSASKPAPATDSIAQISRRYNRPARQQYVDMVSHPIARASRLDDTRGKRQMIPYERPKRRGRFPRLHPAIWVFTTLFIVVAIIEIPRWWQGWQDNVHYGYPRVSQMDAVVGHNDSPANPTHFIFLNLHGQVLITEIPGGDVSRTRGFKGPTLIGAGQDLLPVTGEIRNEDGRLDLIVHIQDQAIVYINDGSTFHEQ